MDLDKFAEKYEKKGGDNVPWAGGVGVYVVAPSCPAKFWAGEKCGEHVPQNVKIGKTNAKAGFAGRIPSKNGQRGPTGRLFDYKTYWPNGVTVHAILMTRSFDPTVHTLIDEALSRETTLRRIFKHHAKRTGFGSNGLGGDNGSGKLGSEWIHMNPDTIMNYLLAAGPMRHGHDKLFGCRPDGCHRVHTDKVKRDVTRLNKVVKALELVLQDEKIVGVKGRPVVLPRTFVEAARDKKHDLHVFADKLQTNVDAEYERAKRRLDNKKKRDLAAIQARLDAQGMTRRAAKVQRRRMKERQKREPRDVAALRGTVEFNIAQDAAAKPSVRKPIKRFVAAPAPPVRPPLPQARPGKKAATAPPKARRRATPNVAVNLNTMRRHRFDRTRYDKEKEAVARKQLQGVPRDDAPSYDEMNEDDAPPETPKKTPPPKKAAPASCPRMSVLKRYERYTYFDVTGDGRCYFYAIIKALGLPLTPTAGGEGKKSDTDIFVRTLDYFDTRQKRDSWRRRLTDGDWNDPIDVLQDSQKMVVMLHEKGIRYVVLISRKTRAFREVNEYMADPIAYLRMKRNDTAGHGYRVTTEGLDHTPGLTETTGKQEAGAFRKAFREGRVITFVWRKVRGLPDHYEIVVPDNLRD